MSKIQAPLKTRILNSLRGLKIVLSKPLYIGLAALSSFFISGFIIWSLNFELVRFIVFEAPINAYEKFRFFWDVQTSVYTSYPFVQATGILWFGLLFGINLALITYVIRNGGLKSIPKKSGGGGLVLAMLSGGCVACGTSILAPVLATLGATSSAFVLELSNWLNWAGIALITYSIYKLGTVINNTKK